jgi:predicted O-methyltransferase YrrM
VRRSSEHQTLLNKDFVTSMLRSLVPLGHHECSVKEGIERGDLGLGLIYYALTRVLKPRKVVIAGSLRGFSVVCIALGLEDNDLGEADFIDAALVDDFWRHKRRVRSHFAKFHIQHRVSVKVMTTRAYLAERKGESPSIDLLFIDADHTRQGVTFDHEGLGSLVIPGGYVVFHDSYVAGVGCTEWEVADYLGSLESLYEMLSLEIGQGVAILRKLPIDSTERQQFFQAESRELRRLATSVIAHPERERPDDQEFAALTLKVLQNTRERDRIFQSRLRFLRKANHDLRKELQKLRPLVTASSQVSQDSSLQ